MTWSEIEPQSFGPLVNTLLCQLAESLMLISKTWIVPQHIQHKFLQARKTNGIWQQRTLRNKQFNIHNKTGMKINEKHNVRAAFGEIQLWPVKWK